MRAFGRVDILINNAGIVAHQPFSEISLADLARQLDVHLIGSFNTCRAVWPHMTSTGYGRIVLTASSAMLGRFDAVAYGSAKASLIGLCRNLALAGQPHNIRTNVIVPRAYSRMWGDADKPASQGASAWPLPEQAAPFVCFLSHEACPASGEIYRTGGGRHSRLFIAETPGAFADTLEDVQRQFEQVNAERDYFVPVDSDDLNNRGALIENAHVAGQA